MVRVAIAQVESTTDKQKNLTKAKTRIEEAGRSRADLIAFPEFLMAFSPTRQSARELAELAEPIGGPFIAALSESAKSAGISVLATIYESGPAPDRVYDTAVWIDALGRTTAVYRKLHLYDAFGFKESDKFAKGAELEPPMSCGEYIYGLMICYDLRFPEMARMLALEGANVLIAPSGWVQGDLKVEHWQTMIKARALENGCYVIAPDQVGNIYIGHSLAVDPLGRVLADLGETERLAVVQIDAKLVQETREKLPLLANRRTDVYGRYAGGAKLPY